MCGSARAQSLGTKTLALGIGFRVCNGGVAFSTQGLGLHMLHTRLEKALGESSFCFVAASIKGMQSMILG